MRLLECFRAPRQLDLDQIPLGTPKVFQIPLLAKVALVCDELRKRLSVTWLLASRSPSRHERATGWLQPSRDAI